MKESEEDAHSGSIPVLLQGFEQLYPLLRSLTSEESSFYERIHVLLFLARWTGEPLTLRDMKRHFPFSLERLSYHLSRLRAGGWLVNEERAHTLTSRGRMLMFVLRLIAQPWEERDSVPVIAQLYAAASSEELGLGPERLFEDVVGAIEASLRRLRRAVSAERTSLVGQYHEESLRNAQMADMALELRQQGDGMHSFDSVARMHRAISALLSLSGELEQQHLTLLERDLLTSGQVTLGDIQMWASQVEDQECAIMLVDHLEATIPQPWYIHEGALIAADAGISNSDKATIYTEAPLPQQYHTLDARTDLYEKQQALSILQGQLRQTMFSHPDGLPLTQWTQRDRWPDALAHLIAVLDPVLRQGSEPIYLHIHSQGELVPLETGAASQVSKGIVSREGSYDF